MNSRKVKGANVAVKFKKNAEKVSSFCCDVIGDICGVISGGAAAAISVLISKSTNINLLFTNNTLNIHQYWQLQMYFFTPPKISNEVLKDA